MSSIHGRPEFRLVFDYPQITVTEVAAPQGEVPPAGTLSAGTLSDGTAAGTPPRVFDLASDRLVPDLRRLAAEIRAARGRLTVVLPEGEVWRGRLALGDVPPRLRGGIARSRAAAAMGLPVAALAVRLGKLDREGHLPAAALRRETLAETRRFLARAGLRPARITAGGAFDGFAEPPQLDEAGLADRLRPALPIAGGAIAAGLLLAFLIRPDAPVAPQAGLIGPEPLAVAEAPAAEAAPATVAELAPRKRPADLVRVTLAPDPAPAAAPRAPAAAAPVTMAARNLPVSELPPLPQAERALRLPDFDVARARVADAVTGLAQLRPGAARPQAGEATIETIRNLLEGTVDAPLVSGASTPPAAAPAPTAAASTAAPAVAPTASTRDARPETITAPRPPKRPAALATPVPAPEPVPAPAPAREQAEAPAPAPAAAAVAAGPQIAPPPARPGDSGASTQIAQAVGAAVVAAGVEAASRSQPAPVQTAGLTPGALDSIARPAPRRAAAAQPTRQPAAPTVSRPAAQPQRVAAPAPQPQRAAAPTVSRPAAQPQRAAAPAAQPQRAQPQRVVTAAAQPQRATTRAQAQPARQQQAAAAQPARQAAAQPARQAAAQPARQQTPRNVVARPANSTATSSTTAAAAATENVNLSRRGMTLIGVFGADRDRYAMVRLPNGAMQRVKAGDQVQGARVAAIGQNSVQFANGGRTTTLAMP